MIVLSFKSISNCKGLNFILLSCDFMSFIAAKLRAEAAGIEHNAQLTTQEAVRFFKQLVFLAIGLRPSSCVVR